MRVVSLAAGAGGMVCGSCIRDNRVVATLIAQGRDISLLPLYTPIRTDEEDVSLSQVKYGGINVYLRQLGVRWLPGWMERLFEAPWLLRRVMRFSSSVRAEDLGPLTVSVLQGEEGAQLTEIQRLIDTLAQLKPDLVNLPDLMLVGTAKPIKDALRIPVLCTLSGEDIFLDQLREPYRDQSFQLIREHSAHVDGFIAVTEYFAEHAARHFSIPRERIHIVPMGVAVDDFLPADPPSHGPFTIGYLARVCPEKGLENLCDALVRLRRSGRNCRVRAAGYLGVADRGYLERIRSHLLKEGVIDRFDYLGEITRQQKIDFLRSLHAFCVPTVYHEAKGLYLLEALASGVPVVQPEHGSFPELVQASGGGLLYDPRDESGLATAVAILMDDPKRRAELGRRGRETVREKFTDHLMAERTWALYERHVVGKTGVA